eukprot:Lithocolla_globosa_v1_NODE_4032_length_1524_cov_14.176310.p2 type:complete len:100 gc:universal NODE_4032_length_1524_cov_14.176310:1119-820(-)
MESTPLTSKELWWNEKFYMCHVLKILRPNTKEINFIPEHSSCCNLRSLKWGQARRGKWGNWLGQLPRHIMCLLSKPYHDCLRTRTSFAKLTPIVVAPMV